MKKIILPLSILLLVSFSSANAVKNIQVVNLMCDYMDNPLAVDSESPLLKWELLSPQRGAGQTAYRILVASDPSSLRKNKGDYWDSGKTPSGESIIKYNGRPLSSGKKLYWKVMVWDQNGKPSKWSETHSWSMGLLNPGDWQAKWIGEREDLYPDSTLTYPAPYFRKEFIVEKPVKKAIVHVSGLGFYEMSVNGEKIGEQVLAPAVTNYDRRSLNNLLYYHDDQSAQRILYNTFDVTDNLLQKENVIGMVLGNGWYNQRDRTIEGHMWYDVPRMILQMTIEYTDGTRDTIVSDNSWKTTTGPILHDAIFTGETYDARLNLNGWNMSGYNDSQWAQALEVRPPTGIMRVQTIPFTKVVKTVKTGFEKINDSQYTLTLPETFAGWCAIKVRGNAGDTVKLRYVSEENLDYGQVDTYILKGGAWETWEPRFTWHAFRTVEVTAGGVEIAPDGLEVKSVYTAVDNTGNFDCSNELFTKVAEAFNRTMHANFMGIISSDPHRERLAYTGDGQIITESLLYCYDMTTFLRKFIDDMEDARNRVSGYVPHTAPFGGGGGGPAWGSAFVIIPWAYYRHYGDTAVLRDNYQGMKQWVGYLGTRTDDRGIIVREEPRGWCLGDWCAPGGVQIPGELVNTAYFYHVASTVARAAKILGKTEDYREVTELAQTIKDNFNTVFFNPETNHYWEGRQGSDVFALGMGLVPEEKREQVLSALLNHIENIGYRFDTGIMATPLLLQVLAENGHADIAYKVMDSRGFPSYDYVLDEKNSTLWEIWDGGEVFSGESGHCHPMFGSVVAWFYRTLAGIKPDADNPGMRHFYIEPIPCGDMKYCNASYKTLYGTVSSRWEIDDMSTFHLAVEVPANTSATVVLPGGDDSQILESGNPVDKVKGLAPDPDNPKRIVVPSGSYSFSVSM